MTTAIFETSSTPIGKAPTCPQNAPRHYAAIHREARRVGWPARFAADVTTWDRVALTGRATSHTDGSEYIRANPIRESEPFGWVLRELGSHTIPILGAKVRGAERPLTGAQIAECHPEARFYVWDPTSRAADGMIGDLVEVTNAFVFDGWIEEARGRFVFPPEAACVIDGCGERWGIEVRRSKTEIRHYCDRHAPAGEPCGGCGLWSVQEGGGTMTMYENVAKVLTGHVSPETAHLVPDYPYGRKVRCRIRYWIESDKRRGQRFCSQTEDPKRLAWNAPKRSTYVLGAMVMYIDGKGHVQHATCSTWSKPEDALAFVRVFGAVTEAMREVRVLATASYTHAVRMAEGKRRFSINGVVQEPTEADIRRYTDEANAWREVAKAARDTGLGEETLAGGGS